MTAGTPRTTEPEGTSRVTSELALIITLSPTVRSPATVACGPIQTWSPITGTPERPARSETPIETP